VFEVKGRELRPFAGPEIPLPPDQDQELLARFEGWRAVTAGSLIEFIVWEWLVNKKRQVPGVDFVYGWAIFGGRTQFGGYVLDFLFPLQKMGWRIQGLRWHRTNPDDRARDQIAAQLLESRGIKVVDLWEDSILTRTEFTLQKAWQGESVDQWRRN
jgi:very-short-patch-repair endonuclease